VSPPAQHPLMACHGPIAYRRAVWWGLLFCGTMVERLWTLVISVVVHIIRSYDWIITDTDSSAKRDAMDLAKELVR